MEVRCLFRDVDRVRHGHRVMNFVENRHVIATIAKDDDLVDPDSQMFEQHVERRRLRRPPRQDVNPVGEGRYELDLGHGLLHGLNHRTRALSAAGASKRGGDDVHVGHLVHGAAVEAGA